MTKDQVTALAEQLRGVLNRINSGDLDASVVLRARIEGALVGLEIVLGADASAVLRRLGDTS